MRDTGGMAARKHDEQEPKRLNRAVSAGEAVAKALGPALKRRGFAGRDIITHWAAIAPAPYDTVTVPDKLAWPRGARGAEGATLHLRCMPGHALALAHEGQKIAAAVNRYFGYVLVREVRISLEPFAPYPAADASPPQADAEALAQIDAAVGTVEDEGVRDALRRLGEAMAARRMP